MRPIRNEADLAHDLAALLAADGRLVPAARLAGPLPLRLAQPGLAGLLRIVSGQQLSTFAAAAVWERFAALGPVEPHHILAMSDEVMRGVGLSRQKVRTFRAVSDAVVGGLNLTMAATGEEGRASLTNIRGIGRWTADVYLMFCGGHPDVLPSGDLAVRKGAGFALDHAEAPDAKTLDAMGEVWAPWRSTAARLFWAVYRVKRINKTGEGLPA